MLFFHLLVGVILFIAIVTLIALAEQRTCGRSPNSHLRSPKPEPDQHGSE